MFKETILNMSKSLTFPLPILAATHLQLIHGTKLVNYTSLLKVKNLFPAYIVWKIIFSGASLVDSGEDITILTKVIDEHLFELFNQNLIFSLESVVCSLNIYDGRIHCVSDTIIGALLMLSIFSSS